MVRIDDDALDHISNFANGDARTALNAIEVAALSTPADKDGEIHITLEVAEDSIQRRALRYDGGGGHALRRRLRLHKEHAWLRP